MERTGETSVSPCASSATPSAPQNNQVLEKKKINNVDFDAASWLILTGKDLAHRFEATPIYVFEATKDLWLPCKVN